MVPVVDNVQCNALLGSGSVTSNMMCAGLTQGGKDTCQVQQLNFSSVNIHSVTKKELKFVLYLYNTLTTTKKTQVKYKTPLR